MKKTESIAEFIARGGTITKLPEGRHEVKVEKVKQQAGGPATFITMDEADLFYGESKPRKTKKKSTSIIDLSALPEELRKKYVDQVMIDAGEEDEDEEDSD